MTIIESLQSYLDSSPFTQAGMLRVDFLGAQPTEYTIDVTPCAQVVRQYADGGSLRQFEFVFGSREFYGADVWQNLQNSGFYERFAAWLEEQTRSGNLPVLSGGRVACSVEALSTGYLYDSKTHHARYQIQCRLLYFKGV